jgi:hypothetical protein
VASSSFRVIHVDVLNQLLHIMKMQYRKWVSYLVSLAEEPGGINSIVSWPAVSGGSENNLDMVYIHIQSVLRLIHSSDL